MNGMRLIVWILLSFIFLDSCRAKRNTDKYKCGGVDLAVVKKGSQLKGSINDVIRKLCLPEHTDRLVYRFKNQTLIRIDFDVVSENKVYSISWDIKTGNPGKNTRTGVIHH